MSKSLTDPNAKGKVLVVDDEHHQRQILSQVAQQMGYEVVTAVAPEDALRLIRFGRFDVLLTDMSMPGMTGIQLLEAVTRHDPTVSVIVVTAHGTVETAVEAMKAGAEDFILKPVEFDALEMVLKRVFQKRSLLRENQKLQGENEALKRDIGIRYHLTNALGVSAQSQKVMEKVKLYLKVRTPVLILGEPGSARQDVARMIHYNSPWARNDLILFDCQSVPEDLQEHHLFGEETSLDGGVRVESRPGLIEKAHLGTLVLANVHRLTARCQPQLARVLREEKCVRVGGTQFYRAYVRVIATSQRAAFDQAAAAETFRKNVHELFADHVVDLRPLRERREDVPILIAAMAKRNAEMLGKEVKKIQKEVVERLAAYDFPGDQRELESMVESAVIRCDGEILRTEHFNFPGSG